VYFTLSAQPRGNREAGLQGGRWSSSGYVWSGSETISTSAGLSYAGA